MKRRTRRLQWKIVLGWLAVHAWIACDAEAPQVPLTSAMVVQALHVRGVEVDAAHVHLPMALYVVGASSELAVVGAEREADRRTGVQLRCVKVSDCVAFTVTLDVDDSAAAAILALTMPTAPVRSGSGPVVHRAMLHAGDRVAVSMQQKHVVLQMPCLVVDTGSMGETIRVSTLDHRRIFHAVVTGPAAATGVSE